MAECVLGCGETRVVILDRCGGRQIGDITEALSETSWARIMDDTSESVSQAAIGGTPDGQACCGVMAETRSWIHSVGIYRDGDLVWGPGPIVDILYRRDSVQVVARDISAWLDVRSLHNVHQFVDTPVLDIAVALITDAMAPDDPCDIIGNIIVIPPAVPLLLTKDYLLTNTVYAGQALRDLAKTSLDFTVVGRSIILSQKLLFGPFGILTDENFLVDLEIEERGLETGTKWYVNGATSTPADSGSAGGISPYLGLIEQIADDESIVDPVEAVAAAQGRVDASDVPPVYLNVPDDARLSPDTPTCMDEMVPGAVYTVLIQDQCREVSQQSRLTAVRAKITAGDESIGVTLSPAGTNYGDAGGVNL